MPSFPVEGSSAQPRTPQGEGGDTGTAASDARRLSERDELARVLDPRAWWIPTDNPALALDRQLRRAQAEVMADNALAAGFRRVAEDPAQVLEKLASDLEDRAWERDRDDGEADAGQQCDGECGNADCHRISAVATWQRAAVMVRDRGAAVRGGEQK